MRSPGIKEIARKLAVLLLFGLFGFCVPGYASPKDASAAGRSRS